MAFQRPTLTELRARARTSIRSRLGIGPLLQRSVLGVIGDTVAAAAHHLYGYLNWVALQAFPDTAEDAQLDRHASLHGLTRTPPASATGSVSVSSVIGTSIPVGTQWRRGDGVAFVLVGAGVITTGSPENLPIQSVVPGVAGNCSIGTALTTGTPIAGLDSAAEAGTDIVGGADDESDASLRARILVRKREVSKGGSASDYKNWSLSISEVTRAWVFPTINGAGTVQIYIATDDTVGGPIPSAGKVAEVQAYIDTVRPVTAAPTVTAPTEVNLDPEIVLTPDTPEGRAAVEQTLTEMLRRDAAPGATLYVSRIREAISIAAGENNHTLTLPAADIVAGENELYTLGTVTWS
jgi:uncharacterized phage protein gp47/JayE